MVLLRFTTYSTIVSVRKGRDRILSPHPTRRHEGIGAVVASVKPDLVFYQGEYAAAVARGVAEAGGSFKIEPVSGPKRVLAALAGLDGGTVLIKGSRFCRMEVYAEAVAKALCPADDVADNAAAAKEETK